MITILDWRKCTTPSPDKWADIATIVIKVYSEGIVDVQGSAYISPLTGDLTILDFVKEDEGLYQCIWDNHEPYHVRLKHHHSKYILVC